MRPTTACTCLLARLGGNMHHCARHSGKKCKPSTGHKAITRRAQERHETNTREHKKDTRQATTANQHKGSTRQTQGRQQQQTNTRGAQDRHKANNNNNKQAQGSTREHNSKHVSQKAETTQEHHIMFRFNCLRPPAEGGTEGRREGGTVASHIRGGSCHRPAVVQERSSASTSTSASHRQERVPLESLSPGGRRTPPQSLSQENRN